MSDTNSSATPGARVRTVARSRGALSGLLLVLLGLWGGLIAFVGGYFHFGYSSNQTWHWTAVYGWYEVLPGAVTAVAGVLLLIGTSRAVMLIGSLLAVAAGGWFVIGPPLSRALLTATVGPPSGSTNEALLAIRSLAYFYLLGALIVFLGATAFGRLSLVSVRDVEHARRRADAERAQAEWADDSAGPYADPPAAPTPARHDASYAEPAGDPAPSSEAPGEQAPSGEQSAPSTRHATAT